MSDLSIQLARTEYNDLHTLFRFQMDEEACFLAAFTPADPFNKAAYMEKYARFLADPIIHMRTLWINGEIIGSIAKFLMEGEAGITYWIDNRYWGKGIATAALQQFLILERTRPIVGRVAFDNYGSQKVLEKCGFVLTGKDKGFANARQMEIEEYIYKLSD